ncbi:hypothetical protein B0H13DRAFT_2373362 [Mycena leptocephala]|nr:hypothetical protein B0H13DRAFT_2373362 [Mycena leptocephala]
MKELETFGEPRRKIFLEQLLYAVGGGITGTVTARVLADHFERVILVDPEIQDNEKPKTRIIQYNAVHCDVPEPLRSRRPTALVEFRRGILAAGGRLPPADFQLSYSESSLPTPYQDYPPGHFPDTLVIRRSAAQKVLHTLLMKHTTAQDITILPGAVRGFEASDDMGSIQSVIVRRPDGTQMHLNDVTLVAGAQIFLHIYPPFSTSDLIYHWHKLTRWNVDCTRTTQSGLKWLETAGLPVPKSLRSSHNGNMRYATMCFSVSPELEATLPIPESAAKTAGMYGNVQHSAYGFAFAGLYKTDHNMMQIMVGDSATDDAEGSLPRTASEVLPYISGFRGHAPTPPWFLETVAILCEYGPITSNSRPNPLQLNPVHGRGFSKIILNGLALNSLLHSVDPGLARLPRDFAARYFKNNAVKSAMSFGE